MSVGFRLRGTYRRSFRGKPSARDVLRLVAEVWHELEPDLVMLEVGYNDGIPTLLMQAHPAVEPLEMTVPSEGVLEVSANTSTGGPGYHRRMVDDVHAVGGRLSVDWQPSNDEDFLDETGYFDGGDPDDVDAAMLTWLKMLLAAVQDSEAGAHAVALPFGHRASVTEEDRVLTAMGPRDHAWVARGAVDPATATDFFSWWGDEQDAAHYRDRAIARMWVDVRWAAPADDASRHHLLEVDRDLQRALDLDGAIDLPWREWAEVRRLLREAGWSATDLDRRIDERAIQVDPGTRLIGYRRGPVAVTIDPGWTITVPGSFLEDLDDDSWVGYDTERSIRLTSVAMSGKDGGAPSADELASMAPSGPTAIGPGDEALRGAAEISTVDEDGRQFPALQGVLASDGQVLILTIVFGDDESWARETYRSIRFNQEE